MTTHALRAGALAVCAAIACAAPVGGAVAQDFSLAPNFGSVSLSAGFPNDPYGVGLTAGGSIDASQALGPNCPGFISNAPDFRLNYSAGGFPLYIYAYSGADTTLVVNAPDGQWYCNDDYDGVNPLVGFSAPLSGQYDIWVGTFGQTPEYADLYISEID